MPRQDKPAFPTIDDRPLEAIEDNCRLQVEVKLDLDELAAAEEERLRRQPRRPPQRRELVRLAYHLYNERRGRERMFNNHLFGEPAWNMLLALYCLPSQGIMLGVTSLGHAANVAPSTGLRWQRILQDEGLIRRGPHVSDARVQLVGLTKKGRSLMEKYLVRLFYSHHPTLPDLLG